MGNSSLMNIISIAGFGITLFGFIITIWQVIGAKKMSRSAYLAARSAQAEIKNSIILADMKTAIKLLQEIRNYMRDGKFENARLRLEDLITSMIQLKQLLLNTELQKKDDVNEISIQLRNICNTIEANTGKPDGKLNIAKINASLSSYSDILGSISSKIMFPPNGNHTWMEAER
jgi:hypothetical protein